MKFSTIALVTFILFSCTVQESDIYQWRGKDRKGIFPEKNLLKIWPEDGPEEIWFLEGIGNGYGSPTITDKEIFITGEIDSTAYLFSISFENGKMNPISEFKITRGKKEHFSHPVINNRILYQRHGNVLMAFDIKDKLK